MSMDDISQDDYYGTPKPTPMRRPVTGKTRGERSVSKTVSVESLHYDNIQYSATHCGSPTKIKYQHPEDIRYKLQVNLISW